MIPIDDFKREDGSTRWSDYTIAQKGNGEICYKCESHIIIPASFGARQLCGSCKKLATEKEEVTHGQYIRCPNCGDQMEVYGNSYRCEMFEEGEHTYVCDNCEHEFEVETHVEYAFTSPALL